MTLPDGRIRLPGPKIDFDAEVGTTGKAHDTFPQPGQARFDHMRSFLIGLLSNQASYNEPVEHRLGTLWYDLNTGAYKFRTDVGPLLDVDGNNWASLASGIELEPGLTLNDWFEQIRDL